MGPTVSVKSFPGTPFSSSFFFSSQTHSNSHFLLLLLHSFSFFSSSQKHQIYFIKKKRVSLPPIIPQTCSSTQPQKWVSYRQTCSSTRPQNLILHGSHPLPCCRCFSKPHPINPASSNRINPTSSHPINPTSSNRFDDRLGRALDLMIDSAEQRKAPPELDRGDGRAGWPSGYRVACDAERCRIGLACDGRQSLLSVLCSLL